MLPFEWQRELYFLLQVFLDLLLLLLVLLLFLQVRRFKAGPSGELTFRLQALEKLTQELEKYLAEEKRLLERLSLALEAGAKSWEKAEPGRRDLREEIRALARKGLSSEEIAQRLSLSLGEVELILSLERFKRGSA